MKSSNFVWQNLIDSSKFSDSGQNLVGNLESKLLRSENRKQGILSIHHWQREHWDVMTNNQDLWFRSSSAANEIQVLEWRHTAVKWTSDEDSRGSALLHIYQSEEWPCSQKLSISEPISFANATPAPEVMQIQTYIAAIMLRYKGINSGKLGLGQGRLAHVWEGKD